MTDDYRRLQREADDSQEWILDRLADAAEEMGRADLALGYRWLKDNRRWPLREISGQFSGQFSWLVTSEADSPPPFQEDLPPGSLCPQWHYFPSRSSALEAGAVAVSVWLRTRRQPSLEVSSPRRYRAHSTFQCGEAIAGDWHDTREEAEAQAVSWRGLPVGASYRFTIEEADVP